MAYNKNQRFPPPPKYHRIFEPGNYQHGCPQPVSSHRNTKIDAPFLSKTPRITGKGNPIWTHAFYKTTPRNIVPNCTALKSKMPRFPYEAFSEKDLEKLLCRCGLNVCECPTGLEQEEKPPDILCQGTRQKKIYKGTVPRPITDDEIHIKSPKFVYDPPFYDTRVKYSTDFYHGWKWSKRNSKYLSKNKDISPGPASYDVGYINYCGPKDICAEKIRNNRKKNSRQLRYIEQLTLENILENHPGPASYNPKFPQGTELKYFGSRSDRFVSVKSDNEPGPANYHITRYFDLVDCKDFTPCLAKLPERPGFGTRAKRFKHITKVGPSPAEYDVKKITCNVLHCNKTAFGSNVERFKTKEECESMADHESNTVEKKSDSDVEIECPKPTWPFRSKVRRFKSLHKDLNSPSPADVFLQDSKKAASYKTLQNAPFLSSEVRFNEWYNNLPVFQRDPTPGPCYYQAEKAKCNPAVTHGPLTRTCRFKSLNDDVPAPNAYRVEGGIETVLKTFNQKLVSNIKEKKKSEYQVPPKSVPLYPTYQEREMRLLMHCLSILDYGEELFKIDLEKQIQLEELEEKTETQKKLLRTFLYRHFYRKAF